MIHIQPEKRSWIPSHFSFFHIVKGPHPKELRLSGNPLCRMVVPTIFYHKL